MMFVVDKEVFGCCGVELLFVEVFECIEIFLFVELIVWVSSQFVGFLVFDIVMVIEL